MSFSKRSIALRSRVWHRLFYHKPKIQRDSSWVSVLIPNVTVKIAHATHVNVLLNINALVHPHQRIENFWSQNGIVKVIGIQIRNNIFLITPQSLSRFSIKIDESFGVISTLRKTDPTESNLTSFFKQEHRPLSGY